VGAETVSNDHFGTSVAISGKTAAASSPDSSNPGSGNGSVCIFEREGETWTETARLLPTHSEGWAGFGASLSLREGVLTIGAPGDSRVGAVYVYGQRNSHWEQIAKLTPGTLERNGEFGNSVSLDGRNLVIGVSFGSGGQLHSGISSLYRFCCAGWVEIGSLSATDEETNKIFENVVALDGRYCVVGARADGENGREAGAAYVFDLTNLLPPYLDSDINMDGHVNPLDLEILLSEWHLTTQP
jgi:hypothetical protein